MRVDSLRDAVHGLFPLKPRFTKRRKSVFGRESREISPDGGARLETVDQS
jgi:hypothetical protein